MSKNRSGTSRRIWGGALGGFLGILLCGFVHTALIPVGVLVGVIVGFYSQEIVEIFVTNWKRACHKQKAILRLYRWKYIRLQPFPALRKRAEGLFARLGRTIPWPIRGFIATHSRFARWLAAHPANRVRMICIYAGSVYILINVVILWLPLRNLWELVEILSMSAPESGKSLVPLLGGLVILIVAILALPAHYEDGTDQDEAKKGHVFSETLRRYADKGSLRFLLSEVIEILKTEVRVTGMVITVLLYMIIAGALYITFALIPILVFFGTLKGIHRLALHTDHWLCLGVTMFVTVSSAVFFNPYLGDPFVVWMIALATGVVSGLAAEVSHRALVYAFERFDILRWAVGPLEQKLSWANKLFVQTGDAIVEKLGKQLFCRT